jgi:hypothetical protein
LEFQRVIAEREEKERRERGEKERQLRDERERRVREEQAKEELREQERLAEIERLEKELADNDPAAEEAEEETAMATALYDYQAAAEDEISFDPDDLITHIEMVSALPILLNLHVYNFVLFRLMKAGGEECARASLASSRPTMSSSMSEMPIFLLREGVTSIPCILN